MNLDLLTPGLRTRILAPSARRSHAAAVVRVWARAPAERETALNTELNGLQAFSDFLNDAKAGQTVSASIMRQGQSLTLSVTLVER